MKRLNTPVLFLIFNRLDTTKQVFEEIRKAKPKKLFIAADGPRNKEEKKKTHEVRKYVLDNIDWECEVKTLFRKNNLGCKLAVGGAITWFFKNIEMGIILEDDCLPSQSFFPFCEGLLKKYKNNNEIFSISGRNHLGIWDNTGSSYFYTNGSIWGWATWRRAWKYNDLKLKNFYNPVVQKKFEYFSENAPVKAKEIYLGCKSVIDEKLSSWAYPWAFTRIINNSYNIIPSKNLIKNIGFSADATHTFLMAGNEPDAYNINFPLKHNNNFEIDYKYINKVTQKNKKNLINRLISNIFRWLFK
ncbi:MAG: nucleotide-diphospho-sugar transferase [Candidatus Woesearchaeota archaeon]